MFIALVDRESDTETKRDAFSRQVDISGITAPVDEDADEDDE